MVGGRLVEAVGTAASGLARRLRGYFTPQPGGSRPGRLQTGLSRLEELGMSDPIGQRIRDVVSQPQGLLLVCGPAGSGKSTTIGACLNEIDRRRKKVVIDERVARRLPGATHLAVERRAGKAAALPEALQRNPDVLSIGEIRDVDTAEICCEAAQNGRMVLASVEAPDVVAALLRLLELGARRESLAAPTSAVLGQRLVRMLCPECKVRYKPAPDMLKRAQLPANMSLDFIYRAPEPNESRNPAADRGNSPVCKRCGGAGYEGQTGVFELMLVTDRLRQVIRDNPNVGALRKAAFQDGLKLVAEDGLRHVVSGETSVQELVRACRR